MGILQHMVIKIKTTTPESWIIAEDTSIQVLVHELEEGCSGRPHSSSQNKEGKYEGYKHLETRVTSLGGL
jgi:hypothetical protein